VTYQSIAEVIADKGLRVVAVRGLPSPWSTAARAILDWKGLGYVLGAQIPGGPNEELVAWSGQNSAPVVAYDDEPPIHRWLDILLLAERLAPEPRLLPVDPSDRVVTVGLSHEIMGEGGLGWWFRLLLLHPAMMLERPPRASQVIAAKYRYSPDAGARAESETAARLAYLGERLAAQEAAGSAFLIGEHLTAADFYCAATISLLSPLAADVMPMPDGFRSMYTDAAAAPLVAAQLTPRLLAHRDRIVEAYFRTPFTY
jgi:glutathione S-transferase